MDGHPARTRNPLGRQHRVRPHFRRKLQQRGRVYGRHTPLHRPQPCRPAPVKRLLFGHGRGGQTCRCQTVRPRKHRAPPHRPARHGADRHPAFHAGLPRHALFARRQPESRLYRPKRQNPHQNLQTALRQIGCAANPVGRSHKRVFRQPENRCQHPRRL